MKTVARILSFGATLALFIMVALLNIKCQYDYSSPNPGLIQVRLKTISNNIPFSALNNFVIKVAGVNALRSDGAEVVIYEDTKSIKVGTIIVNTLDVRARDSSLIIGESDVPPADYKGILLLIEPGKEVILDGYRIIPVSELDGFNPILSFNKSFSVTEGKTTYITLTIDLDKTLVKGAYVYFFEPHYEITSIY